MLQWLGFRNCIERALPRKNQVKSSGCTIKKAITVINQKSNGGNNLKTTKWFGQLSNWKLILGLLGKAATSLRLQQKEVFGKTQSATRNLPSTKLILLETGRILLVKMSCLIGQLQKSNTVPRPKSFRSHHPEKAWIMICSWTTSWLHRCRAVRLILTPMEKWKYLRMTSKR